jgi:hypothetical protein
MLAWLRVPHFLCSILSCEISAHNPESPQDGAGSCFGGGESINYNQMLRMMHLEAKQDCVLPAILSHRYSEDSLIKMAQAPVLEGVSQPIKL